jgi:DNA primase
LERPRHEESILVPREVIEAIRERVDIVEVVSEVVALRRKGSSHMGLCPFHQEKSPSFSVVQSKGIYHCFGCGEGGDAFSFLQKTRGCSFFEAVKELGERVGVPVEERELSPEERRRLRVRTSLLDVLVEAQGWFHSRLVAHPEGRPALDYLHQRGITDETISRWMLGFAPARWDGLISHLHSRGIDANQAVSAGLARRRGKSRGAYDLFRDRVIVPIHDGRGRVVAFGGRIMPGAPAGPDGTSPPKYVNSPETEVYKKSRTLFGLHRARTAVQRNARLLVVEGYFDVISLHQAGFAEAVATCGTSLTPDHARTIRPLTRTVIALFDGDEAGMRAAARSLELFVDEGIEPKRLNLGNHKDPDEFVQAEGPDALERLLRAATPVFDMVVDRTVARLGTSPGGRQGTLRELSPLIQRFPAASRARIVETLARKLALPEAAIVEAIGRPRDEPARFSQAPPLRWRGSVELNHLLWLVVHFPDETVPVLAEVDPAIVTDRLSVQRAVARLLGRARLDEVQAELDDPDLARVLRAVAARGELYTRERAREATEEIVGKMRKAAMDRDLRRVDAAIRDCNPVLDRQQYLSLLRERQALIEKRRTLSHPRRSAIG